MTRQTANTIERIASFMALLDENHKQTPLRLANIGYDIYKESGLKDYRYMSVGQFLSTIVAYTNVPRKLIRVFDALVATMAQSQQSILSTKERISVSETETNCIQILPSCPNAPFLFQAKEVIEVLIKAMSTLGETHIRNYEKLNLSFNKGMKDSIIGLSTNVSRERVRQIRTKFQFDFRNGLVQKELSNEYKISKIFIKELSLFASRIENKSLDVVKKTFGDIEENHLRFIIEALGLDILVKNDKEFIVKRK